MGSFLSVLWYPGLISSMMGFMISWMELFPLVRDALIEEGHIHGVVAVAVLVAVANNAVVVVVVSSSSRF